MKIGFFFNDYKNIHFSKTQQTHKSKKKIRPLLHHISTLVNTCLVAPLPRVLRERHQPACALLCQLHPAGLSATSLMSQSLSVPFCRVGVLPDRPS